MAGHAQFGFSDSGRHNPNSPLIASNVKKEPGISSVENNVQTVSVKKESVSYNTDGNIGEPSAGGGVCKFIKTEIQEVSIKEELVSDDSDGDVRVRESCTGEQLHEDYIRTDIAECSINEKGVLDEEITFQVGGYYASSSRNFNVSDSMEITGHSSQSQQMFNSHMEAPVNIELPYKCKMCPMSFKTAKRIAKHMKISHANISIQCNICHVNFDNVDLLNSHQMTCDSTDISAQCSIESAASQPGSSKPESPNDLLSLSFADDSYPCSNCNETFKCSSSRDIHMGMYCRGLFQSQFKCHQCEKSFSKNNDLKKHMLIHNSDLYKCKHCDESFTLKYKLKNHSRIHTRDLFKCGQCDKSFSEKYKLRTHIGIHNGDLYKCKQCEKAFTQKHNLASHMRIHSGDLFKCNLCDKAFSLRYRLNNHMRTHN